MQFTGVLKRISAKSGTGKRGPWTAYSLCVGPAGNDDNDMWFRYGFEAPNAEEGSVVSFDYEDQGNDIRKINGKLTVDKKATAKQAKRSSMASDDRQASIIRQSATNGAIQIAALMLEHGMVKLPAVAKRYDFTLELIDNIADSLVPKYTNPPSVEELEADNPDASGKNDDDDDEFDGDDPWGEDA